MIHILVVAERIELDRTSEGILACKFLETFTQRFKVTCLANHHYQDYDPAKCRVPWLENVEVRLMLDYAVLSKWTRLENILDILQRSGKPGAFIARKMNALVAYMTGFQVHEHVTIENWKQAMSAVLPEVKPDVVFIRGSGGTMAGAIAASQIDLAIPWIANYQDPFPLSLFPEPYRFYQPIISPHQERMHRNILKSSHALTFPSLQLLEWMLKPPDTLYRNKAFVVPHLAKEMNRDVTPRLTLDPTLLTLLHTGTLLAPRNPSALLKAYEKFLLDVPLRREKTQLIHIGSLNKKHLLTVEDYTKVLDGNLRIYQERHHYFEIIALSRQASVLVLLEHSATHSVFLPGKLADYLLFHKPILALSPVDSPTRDVLKDYPLLVEANDIDGIQNRLEIIWRAWQENQLDKLRPSTEALEKLSENAILDAMETVISSVLTGTDAS